MLDDAGNNTEGFHKHSTGYGQDTDTDTTH